MNMLALTPIRLVSYLSAISVLFINGMCGINSEPAPSNTSTPTVIPDGVIIRNVQTETGLWAENNDDEIETQFNKAGQLISVVQKHQSDYTVHSTSKCVLTYNTDGFLVVRQLTTDYKDNTISQSVSTEKFEYQNRKLSSVSITKNKDENYKVVSPYTITKTYQYDAQGNLIQYKKIDQNGIDLQRYDYGYDNSGKMTSAKEYTKGETSEVEYVFTNGLVARRTVKYQGKVSFINDYTYDNDGQIIRYATINSVGTQSYWAYTYDTQKVPYDFASGFFIDFGVGLGPDYLLFKGHPLYPLSYGKSKHNVLSVTDSSPLGRQQTYTYQYNSAGYPTEVTYSIYNGTQKATTNGKRTYTYYK